MDNKMREQATALILISVGELDKLRKQIKVLMERMNRLYNMIIEEDKEDVS